jgi:hypothetical protein
VVVDGHASVRRRGQSQALGGEICYVVKCLRVSGLLRWQAEYR